MAKALGRWAVRVVLGGALGVGLAGCCCRPRGGTDPLVEQGGVGRGIVNAKRTSTNQTGRGIVRASPDFRAAEVTRLNPGTEVTLVKALPGGWYQISWPFGVNTSQGFLHGDVLKVVTSPGG